MAIDEKTIAIILKRVARGASFTTASTYFGQYRVRVNRGPFGILTSKYEMNSDTYDALRQRLKQQKNRP